MLDGIIRRRLALETGTLYGSGHRQVALVYPSPYPVGMSSLGFQVVYRMLNNLPDTVAERAFLPADDEPQDMLLTYESERPVGNFGVLAFSVAYELELAGMLTCLKLAGLPVLASERKEDDPWVIAGGPLTFSNPLPLGPFVDVIVMGEAEDLLVELLDTIYGAESRQAALKHLAGRPGFYVPSEHGELLSPVAAASQQHLPAYSSIITPDMALSNMHLVEAERGCSRGCSFCVMRRSTNGGMRLADVDRVVDTVPEHARRVGLVGAAVSDHPRITDILRALIDRGLEVSLSSLRADRMTPEFVDLLRQAGYRTLTVASDGASERLRTVLMKRIREKHLLRTAELTGEAGIAKLKVYMMAGVPGETMEDLDELIAFTRKQAAVAGKRTQVSLGLATFVAKRNTPLDQQRFIGIRESERRIEYVRKGLAPDIEVRPISSRWAWVEYVLAQGGAREGLLVRDAWEAGGKFSDYRRAFKSAGIVDGEVAPKKAWKTAGAPLVVL